MREGFGPDGANLIVLEAIMVALLVLGAFAFFSVFTPSVKPAQHENNELRERASDALASLALRSANGYANALAETVSKGLAGNCTSAQARLGVLLPVDARFELRFDDGGNATRVCGEEPAPRAERVGATRIVAGSEITMPEGGPPESAATTVTLVVWRD